MRIVVIGAGAMGSLFGSLLATVAPVVLLNHRKAHCEAINARGLVVEGLDGSRRVHRLAAVSDPQALGGPFDLAIVFTKAGQTRAAAEAAARVLTPGGAALSLQNGLGNREVLAEILGSRRALVGVTSQGATLMGPGRVRHAGDGPTWIARPGHGDRVAAAVCRLFNAAGIQTELSDDAAALVWGKLIVNVGINALAALLRVPNGVLRPNRPASASWPRPWPRLWPWPMPGESLCRTRTRWRMSSPSAGGRPKTAPACSRTFSAAPPPRWP